MAYNSSNTWYKRMRVWKHNSFFGWVRMGEVHMLTIAESDSCTKEARDLAYQINAKLRDLRVKLKTRVD